MNYTVSTIEKIDERFDFNNTSKYIKSIQLSLNGFSYIATNPDESTHLALRHYDFGTEIPIKRLIDIVADLFKYEDILAGYHNHINLSFVSRPWAMVPEMLFNKNNINKLLDINYKADEFSDAAYCKIPGSNIIIASRIPTKLVNLLDDKSSKLNIIPHQAAFLYNGLQTLKHNNNERAFFMAVHDHFFELAYFKENEIKFYNNFPYNQYADVLYYTLAAMEKLEVSPAHSSLFLQGNDLVKEIIPNEIKKHIKNVYLDNQLYKEQYTYHFDQLPMYKYKLLTGIYRCGS